MCKLCKDLIAAHNTITALMKVLSIPAVIAIILLCVFLPPNRPKDAFQFAVDLYDVVSENNPNQNIIVSPIVVQIALGLLFMGAEGSTSEEIVKGSGFPTNNRTTIGTTFEEVLRNLNSNNFKIANKLYVNVGYNISSDFEDTARNDFQSSSENIDFSSNLQAAQIINSWVEQRTNYKIKNMINADQLDSNTHMVLVNALYFQASWLDKFDKDATRKGDFWINEEKSVQVDMLVGRNLIQLGPVSQLDAKMAMIPYTELNVYMVVILPNKQFGLSDLVKKLKTLELDPIFEKLPSVEVDIELPKFKIEANIDLRTVFSKMGMSGVFSKNVNFGQMSPTDPYLPIDIGIHKTQISVVEEGTEPSGSRVYKSEPKMADDQFKVDHPFFFAVISNGIIASAGCVRNF